MVQSRPLAFLLITLLFILPSSLSAQEKVRIFDVRKSIPLNDSEKPLKDFYISGGGKNGLHKGLVVPIQRRVPVHDPYLNKSAGDLYIDVGEIQIIYAEADLSVGRYYSHSDPYFRPLVHYEGFMVGDLLNLKEARVPAKKTKGSQAAQDPGPETPQVEIAKAAQAQPGPPPPQAQPPAQPEKTAQVSQVLPQKLPPRPMEVSKKIPIGSEITTGQLDLSSQSQ